MLYGVNDVSLLTGKTTWMEIQDALLSRAVQLSNERFQFCQVWFLFLRFSSYLIPHLQSKIWSSFMQLFSVIKILRWRKWIGFWFVKSCQPSPKKTNSKLWYSKGPSFYYVRVFWGFLEPPNPLRKDIESKTWTINCHTS